MSRKADIDIIVDDGDVELTRRVLPHPAARREPKLAAADIRIDRPDLGRGCYTVVRKGQPIPAALVDRPSSPLLAPAGAAPAVVDQPGSPRRPRRR